MSASREPSVRARRRDRLAEATRFLAGGASTTIVSYAVYLGLIRWLPYVVAYAIAYVLGIAWSYFANTWFVFRGKLSLTRAALFPLVYVVQFLAGTLLLALLVEYSGVPRAYAPLAVIAVTLPLTYFLSRKVITGRFARAAQDPHSR